MKFLKSYEGQTNARQIHGKFVKCTETKYDYLFLYSKYHYMSAQKQVTYFVCNIMYPMYHTQCQDVNMLHMANTSDLNTNTLECTVCQVSQEYELAISELIIPFTFPSPSES